MRTRTPQVAMWIALVMFSIFALAHRFGWIQ